jgi:hypothetical protein
VRLHQRQLGWAALTLAVLYRSPKDRPLPTVDELLGDKAPVPAAQSEDEMFANLRVWGMVLRRQR